MNLVQPYIAKYETAIPQLILSILLLFALPVKCGKIQIWYKKKITFSFSIYFLFFLLTFLVCYK